MRIIQIIQRAQLRGAEVFACQLSNQLLSLGHEVIMVSIFPGDETLPFRGRIIVLNRHKSKRIWDLQGWRELHQIVVEFQPHIVQANAGDTLKYCALSKFIFRWKASLVFRNANKVSDFIDSFPKLIFNRLLLSQVSHILSVSKNSRLDFIDTFKISVNRVTHIPIGIDLNQIQPLTDPEFIAFVNSGKVLVHVASFVPEKNHIGLLRIFKSICKDNDRNVKLILVGTGPLVKEVESLIIKWGLKSYVKLMGVRKDVLSIMLKGHVFLLPSLIEGLPGVILEAMFSKLPVVAYNVGGISEVINNKTGFLIEKGNEVQFKEAICSILEQTPNQVIYDAYELVVTNYSNSEIARRFLAAYDIIINH